MKLFLGGLNSVEFFTDNYSYLALLLLHNNFIDLLIHPKQDCTCYVVNFLHSALLHYFQEWLSHNRIGPCAWWFHFLRAARRTSPPV